MPKEYAKCLGSNKVEVVANGSHFLGMGGILELKWAKKKQNYNKTKIKNLHCIYYVT